MGKLSYSTYEFKVWDVEVNGKVCYGWFGIA